MVLHRTPPSVAAQLAFAAELREISLAQLVDWAETVLLDGEFAEQDVPALRHVISRLGVADVRPFGGMALT